VSASLWLVTTHLVDVAQEIADSVLFPAALETDRTATIPDTHWQVLADAGLYGIAAPAELGGPGLELGELTAILEAIAGGCLATAFTWVQHHGALASISVSTNTALRDELVPELVAGRLRAGVAFAGAVPIPPRMQAQRIDGGWRLFGHAPFVSGWGVIDVLQVSAVDVDSGDILAGIVPAEPAPGIAAVTPQPLFVADATKTVSLDVDGLVIADDRMVSRVTRPDFMANQNFGSRLNGTLPIGLALRCAKLLAAGGRTEEAASIVADTAAIRGRLDTGLADSVRLLEARADGAELAVRAASTLVASDGGAAILQSSPAQLLARSAIFTLVAASRPELKKSLVQRFSRRQA
jgi:alkylation response protein AidB-like acyl-CoA dehydrogenase